MARRAQASEISVIVQGPVHPDLTRRACESIRRVLPGSEVILSTWVGEETAALSGLVDHIVENEDPGDTGYANKPNTNRQIVSAFAGIRRSSRPYLLKTRSDILFNTADFLDIFGCFRARESEFTLFKERVLVICSSHPEIMGRYAVGDMVMFGRREDIASVWDIPLIPEPETPSLSSQRKKELEFFFPEQYIFCEFVRKTRDVSPFCNLSEADGHLDLFMTLFMNNFVSLSADIFGAELLKPRLRHLNALDTRSRFHPDWFLTMLFGEWCAAYQARFGTLREEVPERIAGILPAALALAALKATLYTPAPPNQNNVISVRPALLLQAAEEALSQGDLDAARNASLLLEQAGFALSP